MAEDRGTYASHQELEQLREEVQRLRKQQEKPANGAGNGKHADSDGNQNGDHAKGAVSERPKNEEQDKDGQEKEEEKKPHPLRKWIILGAVVVIAIVAGLWWLHARNYESTDDATVDAHISGLAARVNGTIVGVYAEENQYVKAGETLVDLDPRDLKAALEQAQAQLAQAENQRLAEQPNVPVTQVTQQTNIATSNTAVTGAQASLAAAERSYDAAQARIREAEATNAKAQADVERYRPLAEKDEVPREQFDQVVATAKAQAATVAANQASAEAARRQVEESRAQLTEAQQRAQEAAQNAPRQIAVRQADVASRGSAVQAAKAQVEQALLNLSYCKIEAPVNGIVAKRTAEVGQRVSPGQQVFLIAQMDDLWVTANFRETQLRRMRPGQSVRIHVDALAHDYDGYVESMPAASGSVTSLLPPENATGNFVKIVQRLPVRIRFKKGENELNRLRPGMSVEPKVALE